MSDRDIMIKELKIYFKDEFYTLLYECNDWTIKSLFGMLNGRMNLKKSIKVKQGNNESKRQKNNK